ncbi:MAG: ribonuclease J [Caldilineaceae bacterium]
MARKHDRRIGVIGRSMVNNVRIAIKLGYLDIAQDELLTTDEMENLPAHKVVIVATGSQGEPTSAMVRMSVNDHRQISLREGDTVVLSATPIPGNEELFNKTIDNLFRQGVNVLYYKVGNFHVSGHGGRKDYRRMFELVRPEFFIPVHGEYRHLVLHRELAIEMRHPGRSRLRGGRRSNRGVRPLRRQPGDRRAWGITSPPAMSLWTAWAWATWATWCCATGVT